MDEMQEITREFLIESNEQLDEMDGDLVELEKTPDSKEVLQKIFRALHTMKGSSGTLGFKNIEKLSNSGESLLSVMRDGRVHLDTDLATWLFAMNDAIRRMLTSIETTGNEGRTRTQAVIDHLTMYAESADGAARPAKSISKKQPAGGGVVAAGGGAVASLERPDSVTGMAGPPPGGPAVPPAAAEVAAKTVADAALAVAATASMVEKALEIATAPPLEPPVAEPPIAATAPAVEDDDGPSSSLAIAKATIRVDVNLLDNLMDLVGELVLTRNQILQLTSKVDDPTFLRTAQKLKILTSSLQEGITKTRMQPIAMLWKKVPRLVRDLAAGCGGKHIKIEMSGAETELDKTILEAINDPLLHLLRNAVDHGIETRELRKQRGKPETGTISLRAYHEGGQVNIQIRDDGNGIDVAKVKQKAVEQGFISAAQAAGLSDQEAQNLIFLPGLTTATIVTNVSGRGVGMDVVKTNIEKIGGTVLVRSEPGKGTSLSIKLPLTLAIVPALIVASGGEQFAIPQANLIELVRLEGEAASREIERIHGFPVYRRRGNLLPLIELNAELDLTAKSGNSISIVVLQSDGDQFGVVVDEIYDTEEIVVKPLGAQLKGHPCFSGATILGSGHVALILDAWGLAKRAGSTADEDNRSAASRDFGPLAAGNSAAHSWLLFRVGKTGLMALPMSGISRLEKIEIKHVERSGHNEVVQYRGQIMPLIRIANELGLESAADAQELQVIVYPKSGRVFGLVVDDILDIIAGQSILDTRHVQHGVAGCAVIQDRVTDLLDVNELLAAWDVAAEPDATAPDAPADREAVPA